MKSYTTLRNLASSLANNTNSTILTLLDQLITDGYRLMLGTRDWPFLHRPRTLTTFAPTAIFTAVAGTDVCTAADNILTTTGTLVTFSTTDTLPAGLSASTNYYLIYQSATTFKVATSLANALAGTAVDITDTGTGTHTVSVTTIFQPLPYDVDQVESVSVKVSSVTYSPKPAPSKKFWDELQYNSETSDIPEYWFVENGQFALYPRPANDGNIVTLTSKINVIDLTVADFTTGTVDIVTNGSVLVTGSGTSWTTAMVGKFIRITHTNTAASSGDGQWYEVVAVGSSTTLLLSRPYGGRSLTTGAGAAYIIGQMPLVPEIYHVLPVWYALGEYWDMQDKETLAKKYQAKFDLGMRQMVNNYGINDLSMVVDDGLDATLINPNLTVRL